MTQKIKGITVELLEAKVTGKDPFGKSIKVENWVKVENVLVSPTLSDDVVNSMSLYGKKAIYQLAIPKGDTHDWEDTEVKFFGSRFKTFGFTTEGIEDLIPLSWNKKVMVERYG